jgi:site-specific DNA recombinase
VDEEPWNAVQARLSANLTERRQARIASGALLAGVIFDDRGHRMSPTYTVRRSNRYRYYISQARLRGGEPGSRPRIGADEVEQLVVRELCRQQGRDHQITDVAGGAWSADIRELVRTAVDRIVIYHDGIEIALKSNAIDHTGSPTTVRLPLPPPSQIIVPGNSGTRPRRIDHELIRALARARSWMGMLQQGEFADTAEIAQGHGLSEPHVRRLLRFAYLAPDIVEAIVEGRQPRTLTVKLLLQGIPLDWSDQRAAFGLC